MPTSNLWGARESQVGSATVRRLAALRLDHPFMRIDNTKACPELERPTAIIDVIRAEIWSLSKCAGPAAHYDERVRTRSPIDKPSVDGHPDKKGDTDAIHAAVPRDS